MPLRYKPFLFYMFPCFVWEYELFLLPDQGMSMNWHQLIITAPKDSHEIISDFLLEQGALSITLQDAKDEPLYEPKPNEEKLWTTINIIGLFDDSVDQSSVAEKVRQVFQSLEFTWQDLADQQWERSWLENFKPMKFGDKLYVTPTCYDPVPNYVNLLLDPGLAFGTGTHPTTSLCLQWLDQADLKGRLVVDYGCGSGILGIAALLLGANQVHSVDNDEQAITATIDNATKNKVNDKIYTYLPEQLAEINAELLLANILAEPIIGLASLFAKIVKPKGQIVLSGILEEQADEVMKAYLAFFIFDDVVCDNEWVRLSGIRRAD